MWLSMCVSTSGRGCGMALSIQAARRRTSRLRTRTIIALKSRWSFLPLASDAEEKEAGRCMVRAPLHWHAVAHGFCSCGVPVRTPLCLQIVAEARRRLSHLSCLQPRALRRRRSGCLWFAPILCVESLLTPLLDPPTRAYPWLYSSRRLEGEGEKAVESIEDCSWGSKAKAPEEADV
ncbi:hypothetical protein DFH09DRAFT_1186677 [Mycena vulgaris]|nr:hypothetical protein DFH09DRAFT_1186677 [Mycena vulgaris]